MRKTSGKRRTVTGRFALSVRHGHCSGNNLIAHTGTPHPLPSCSRCLYAEGRGLNRGPGQKTCSMRYLAARAISVNKGTSELLRAACKAVTPTGQLDDGDFVQ